MSTITCESDSESNNSRRDSVASSVNDESIQNTLRSGRHLWKRTSFLLTDMTTIGFTIVGLILVGIVVYNFYPNRQTTYGAKLVGLVLPHLHRTEAEGPFHIHHSPEVHAALKKGLPIVALESTIISHGMPYPQNVETARKLEQIVRDGGAVPATVAIIDGKVRLGLTDSELEVLADGQAPVTKVSRRDFGLIISRKAHGATTVAATMMVAAKAGVSVFATGGIGGVHMETEGDVSADLDEFANSEVLVVSAGVKAILDVPQTLEVLETRGVPVIGYGVDHFPCFYSRQCFGLKTPMRVDTPEAIAALFTAQRAASPGHGVLVANPVPEAMEFPFEEMEGIIHVVRAEAIAAGVTGKAITPYFLRRIAEITEGRSLATNIALVENNVALATEIAVELTNM